MQGWIFSEGDQARFLTWAEDIASRAPSVRSFAQFLLRDLSPGSIRVGEPRKRAFGQWQSGLLTEQGQVKLGVYHFPAASSSSACSAGGCGSTAACGSATGRGRCRSASPRGIGRVGAVADGSAAREVPAAQFSAEGRGAFVRFAPAPGGGEWRYRMRYLDGDVWRASVPAIRAVER